MRIPHFPSYTVKVVSVLTLTLFVAGCTGNVEFSPPDSSLPNSATLGPSPTVVPNSPTPSPSSPKPFPSPTTAPILPQGPEYYGLEPLDKIALAGTKTKIGMPTSWRGKNTRQGMEGILYGANGDAYFLDAFVLPSDFGYQVTPQSLKELADAVASAGGQVVTSVVYSPRWGRIDVAREGKPTVSSWVIFLKKRAVLVTLTPEKPVDATKDLQDRIESVLYYNLENPANPTRNR